MSDSDLWFSRAGAFMAFSAYHTASGSMEFVELYKIYTGERLCDSSEHIGRLLGYLLSTMTSMFMGGRIIGATLFSNCKPELGCVGLLFMVMMYIVLLRGQRGGSRPTWISAAFIWLARSCL